MPIQRRQTTAVRVKGVTIGSGFPIVIQSMTDTPTADITATVEQIKDLVNAGSEMVRLAVNDETAARAVPEIVERLHADGCGVPLIGDFHFNGHILLSNFPEMAALLAKYRINPGNLGHGHTHDEHFEMIINTAIRHRKPVRIGVNSGSLDPELFAAIRERDAAAAVKRPERVLFCEAMVQSALQSARQAVSLGLPEDQIILSAKTSDLQDLIAIYQSLADQCPFPLHLGLTEAGSGDEGLISSTAAVSILLQQGIGDTLRVSLTPGNGFPRTREVSTARMILQSLGIRYFQPRLITCPGCGRTSSGLFQEMSHSVKNYIVRRAPEWEKHNPATVQMTVAVMGCVVNGPGESRNADIGIALPGAREHPSAPVFIKGKHAVTLNGSHLTDQFLDILEKFVQTFST